MCESPFQLSWSTSPGVQRRQGPCLHSPAANRPLTHQSEGVRVRHKSTFLEGLVGIFQEKLHPTGEFHSQPCCPGLRLRRGCSGSFWFCPAPAPRLQSPGQGASNHNLLLFAVECEDTQAPRSHSRPRHRTVLGSQLVLP